MKMHSSRAPSSRHHLGQVLQSLRNPELVRSKGYVNGEWVDGRDGEYFALVGKQLVLYYAIDVTLKVFVLIRIFALIQTLPLMKNSLK